GAILRWDLASGARLPDLAGHRAWVTGILFPPGGRSLVTVGWDSVVRRWDLPAGTERPAGDGFRGHLYAAASPDGRYVAAGDRGGRLGLYEAATGRPARALQESGPGVVRLAWTPDGRLLAVGRADGAVGLWDAASGREARV